MGAAGMGGASGGSKRESPEKGSRSRLGEWVQTTQGIIAIIAGIVALIGSGTGVAIATNQGSSSSSPAAVAFAKTATAAQLTQALLPAPALGTGATVRNSGTNLSDVASLCGQPLPAGAQLTAYQTLQDGQTGQYLEEFIIEWDNPADAATLIRNDHAALDQTGGCSAISGGQATQFTGDAAGSAPQQCDSGQYVATQVSIQSASLFGFHASAQCGSYTISVTILGGVGSTSTHDTANGYLNSAVGMLQQTLR